MKSRGAIQLGNFFQFGLDADAPKVQRVEGEIFSRSAKKQRVAGSGYFGEEDARVKTPAPQQFEGPR